MGSSVHSLFSGAGEGLGSQPELCSLWGSCSVPVESPRAVTSGSCSTGGAELSRDSSHISQNRAEPTIMMGLC